MKKIIEKILGRKYYIVLFFDGVQEYLAGTAFVSRPQAIRHAESHIGNSLPSYRILSLRTREPIVIYNSKLI